MEAIKKNRKVCRAAFTRCANELEQLLLAENVQFLLINVSLEILQQKFSELQTVDKEMYALLLAGDASEEDLNNEVDNCEGYLKKYTHLKLRCQDLQRSTNDVGSIVSRTGDASSIIESNVPPRRTFKLPVIEFKKFSGDIHDWLGFWAQFRKIHEDNEIDPHDKISYLIQATVPGSRARQLVESFPAMQENYDKIIDSLRSRFGRKDLLIEVYVRELLQLILNNSMASYQMDISTLYDKMETQLRALETLGITKNNCAAILFPLIESCLPNNLLRAWQRSSEFSSRLKTNGPDPVEKSPMENRLDSLLSFMKSEVESEQRIRMAAENFGLPSSSDKSRDLKRSRQRSFEKETPTAADLMNYNSAKCVFCDGMHDSEHCFKAQKYSISQLKDALTKRSACFQCVKRGHQFRQCRSLVRCLVCSEKHVTIMCPELPSRKEPVEQFADKASDKALTSQTCTGVFLQTLKAKIINGHKSKQVRILLDTGSQRSYILRSTVQELEYVPIRSENLIHTLFGGHNTSEQKHNFYRVRLSSPSYSCAVEVLDQPEICNEIQPVFHGSWSDELESLNITLSDASKSGPIEILLGADIVGKLYTGRKHILKCGLVAVETSLGWTLMGKIPSSSRHQSNTSSVSCFSLFAQDMTIEDLWKLEVLGITEPTQRKTKEERELEAKELFSQTITKDEEGRYKVGLPWLQDHPPLPSYYSIAKKRLETTRRKLENSKSIDAYSQIFTEWLSEGIIETVPKDLLEAQAHYLPHRPVFKESSLTTKIRPVFDASVCLKGKPSLNSCLEVGPNLIEAIPTLLLRFRTAKLGVVSDIRKAFLQINLQESDRDFLRFFWFGPDGEDIVYRHRRVVFGVSSSPFLLGATIEHHLRSYQRQCGSITTSVNPRTIEKLMKCFYVDNCVTSVPDYKTLSEFIEEAKLVMNDAKFDLRGWEFTREDGEKCDPCLVLGILWKPDTDTLKINEECLKLSSGIEGETITKRLILSRTQKIFDPMGITCATTLCPKLLLQQTWAQKISWDEPVGKDIEKQFRTWIKDLPYLLKIEISRWIRGGLEEAKHLSLHMFCDASKAAYSAVVFLRAEMEDQVHVSLLAARSRVAPMKKMTIPRLELLGATIGARLCASLKDNFEEGIAIYYWSDSSTVISWIQRQDEWTTFVGNRVREIRSNTDPKTWRHIPGHLNPADLPSRGCSAKYLYESKWWKGPSWLYDIPTCWPQNEFQLNEEEVFQERRKRIVTTMLNISAEQWHLNYFSKYIKTLRMVAWLFRFVNNCTRSKDGITGGLTSEEIDRAEKFVLKVIQRESFPGENDNRLLNLHCFQDEDGLIRVKTRISNREDINNFRFPVVLPKEHPLVHRLICYLHETSLHVGTQGLLALVRENYWVLGVRRLLRSVVSKCVTCKKQTAKPIHIEAPPLPQNRVRDAEPFEVTGVDFAGPLYLKSGQKAWICLFTCAVYRAVHLELTSSLSTACFVQAFRRFTARRGRPKVVYSDNGTNFVGTENAFAKLDWNLILEHSSVQRINWHFNPPTAAWWGGFWERLIGILKRLLRKVLGRASLGYEDLLTLICECEDIINMRPITYVSTDPSDLIPLTPCMFLRDAKDSQMPDCDAIDRTSLCRKMRYKQKLREDLRRRFRSEYLGQLKFKHSRKREEQLSVGDIVLVGNDSTKRLDWPIGRITELISGVDGKIRVAKIFTSKGVLSRPLQRLFPLECSNEFPHGRKLPEHSPPQDCSSQVREKPDECSDSEIVNEVDSDFKSGVPDLKITRSGRVSRLPRRYL